MVQNLQVNSEIWNRNIDILNMITYGDLTRIAGDQRGSLRQMHSSCYVVLSTIAPMYYDAEQTEVTRKDGEILRVNRQISGIKTRRFRERSEQLNLAKRFMLASENYDISKYGRWVSSQRAYEILQQLSWNLSQDIEDLGLNKKDKTPGAAAALTGT